MQGVLAEAPLGGRAAFSRGCWEKPCPYGKAGCWAWRRGSWLRSQRGCPRSLRAVLLLASLLRHTLHLEVACLKKGSPAHQLAEPGGGQPVRDPRGKLPSCMKQLQCEGAPASQGGPEPSEASQTGLLRSSASGRAFLGLQFCSPSDAGALVSLPGLRKLELDHRGLLLQAPFPRPVPCSPDHEHPSES